jgi:hypothetical protein
VVSQSILFIFTVCKSNGDQLDCDARPSWWGDFSSYLLPWLWSYNSTLARTHLSGPLYYTSWIA